MRVRVFGRGGERLGAPIVPDEDKRLEGETFGGALRGFGERRCFDVSGIETGDGLYFERVTTIKVSGDFKHGLVAAVDEEKTILLRDGVVVLSLPDRGIDFDYLKYSPGFSRVIVKTEKYEWKKKGKKSAFFINERGEAFELAKGARSFSILQGAEDLGEFFYAYSNESATNFFRVKVDGEGALHTALLFSARIGFDEISGQVSSDSTQVLWKGVTYGGSIRRKLYHAVFKNQELLADARNHISFQADQDLKNILIFIDREDRKKVLFNGQTVFDGPAEELYTHTNADLSRVAVAIKVNDEVERILVIIPGRTGFIPQFDHCEGLKIEDDRIVAVVVKNGARRRISIT